MHPSYSRPRQSRNIVIPYNNNNRSSLAPTLLRVGLNYGPHNVHEIKLRTNLRGDWINPIDPNENEANLWKMWGETLLIITFSTGILLTLFSCSTPLGGPYAIFKMFG